MRLLLLALIAAATMSDYGATVVVQMINYTFSPASQTVTAGDTITWTNLDLDYHTTTSGTNGVASGLWDSGLMNPGASFSFTFNVPPGAYPYFCSLHYTIGMIGSVTVLPGNVPPTVSIDSPTNGTVFPAGSAIAIQASAADADGTVTQVNFYSNGNPIGSVAAPPFSVTLTNVAPGQYALSAVAVDNQGATSAPAAVNVTVQPANLNLSVSITNPLNGQAFSAGANIPVQAAASEPGGTVNEVEFFVNGISTGTLTNQPYALLLTNVAAGHYLLTAMATDDGGATATSLAVSISVFNPPLVTLTQPPAGATFPLGSNVTLTVTVGANSAAVTNLEFFASAALIGQAGMAPFTVTWHPPAAGPFSLTAIAFDELGQAGTSAPVAVRAFIPESIRPTIAITNSPPNSARLTSGQISIAGTARDDIGVDHVEFQINGGPFQAATGTTSWLADITLSAGRNAVGLRAVDLAGNTSLEVLRYFTYVVDAPLTVQTIGSGTVAPDLNNQLLEIGKVYQMTAQPGAGEVFTGWSGGLNSSAARLTFQMQSNLVLVANFATNPFPAVAGAYTGLILNTNGAFPANSAVLTLQLGNAGLFSGNLAMNGAHYPFLGRFDLSSAAQAPVLRPDLKPVALALQLDLSRRQISGNATDGTWTSPLLANREIFNARSNPAPQASLRLFMLQRTPADGGTVVGSGAMTIAAGDSTSIFGSLADGRIFSLRTALAADGDVPFYLSFGHGAEIMIGWLHVPVQPATSVTGTVFWSKPAANGFSAELIVAP